MSQWTGGGLDDGRFSLGTPSGGGTFLNHFPLGGPHPDAGGFDDTGVTRDTETIGTLSWKDVLKQIALLGGQTLVMRHLTPDTVANPTPRTPNNKGNAGSAPEPIFLDLGDDPVSPPIAPPPGGGAITSARGIGTIALVAAGLFAVVILPMMGKG